MNKDYVTRNEFNSKIAQKMFYYEELRYAGDSGQTIYGKDGGTYENLVCFGDNGVITINVPRDGTYKLVANIYCAGSLYGANSDLYFSVDDSQVGHLVLMDEHYFIVPLTAFTQLTKGLHTIKVQVYCARTDIVFKSRPYAQQQFYIEEM